jgi:serine/threonine protein kinase
VKLIERGGHITERRRGSETRKPSHPHIREPRTANHSSWEFEEGDRIADGRYALQRLGGGHRYEAYLAWDERLFTTVVVKILRPHRATDSKAIAGLVREVEMIRKLDHPMVLRGFDAVLDGPRPHVVLEHVEGPRLATVLRKYGPLQWEQLVPLALQCCSVLHYFEGEGIVHLDVKPSNIVMGPLPRLIDFSVARTIWQVSEIDSPVGTDMYMAPEQCDPPRSGAITTATDIWGLGATLYESIIGSVPFPRPSLEAPRWPQLQQDAPLLPDTVLEPIAKPIMWCLERNPTNRPSAAALAGCLEPLLEALPRKPVIGRLKPKPS